MIALLLHFGLIKVGGSVDRNWSTETCCHGPVTGKVKTAEGWWTAVQVPQTRATGNYNKHRKKLEIPKWNIIGNLNPNVGPLLGFL